MMTSFLKRESMSLLPVLLATLFYLKECQAVGFIEVRFDHFEHDCSEDGSFFGIGESNCDPMFTFCLGWPRKDYSMNTCEYGRVGESSHFQDRSAINFGANIGGIANPWLVKFTTLESPSVMLVIQVRDDDTIGGDDHMAYLARNMSEVVYPSQAEAEWHQRFTSANAYIMRFSIRLFCDAHYYGAACSVYCLAQDLKYGHYICEAGTGDKVCLKGWQGTDCDEDVDECASDICRRGTCENKMGDYFCHCPVGYTGKNCNQRENACEYEPCLHNGTCLYVHNSGDYECRCTQGWTGMDCGTVQTEEVLDPCVSGPCLNGGGCQTSGNGTFTCRCPRLYTGDICNHLVYSSVEPVVQNNVTPAQRIAKAETHVASKEGFPVWLGVIIALLICIAVLSIIIYIFIIKPRRKESPCNDGLPPGQTVVVFDGEELAFENNLYNKRHSQDHGLQAIGNMASNTDSDINLFNPEKSAEDDMFNPGMKFTERNISSSGRDSLSDESDCGASVGGAEGGYARMGGDGNCKASTDSKSFSNPLSSQRVKDNDYSDFNNIGNATQPKPDEVEYEDLEGMAKGFKKTNDNNDVWNDHDLGAPPSFEEVMACATPQPPRDCPPPVPPPRSSDGGSSSSGSFEHFSIDDHDAESFKPKKKESVTTNRSENDFLPEKDSCEIEIQENAYAVVPVSMDNPQANNNNFVDEETRDSFDLSSVNAYAVPESLWHNKEAQRPSSSSSHYDHPPSRQGSTISSYSRQGSIMSDYVSPSRQSSLQGDRDASARNSLASEYDTPRSIAMNLPASPLTTGLKDETYMNFDAFRENRENQGESEAVLEGEVPVHSSDDSTI